MSERKDFKKYQVEIVYDKQEGICPKCGNTLAYGFHRHHEDGNSENNSIDNLKLYCPTCHGGEQYKTLMKQKEAFLDRTLAILDMAQDGKLSGALTDKLGDLMKLGLSLSNQVHGYEVEKPPASIRMKNQLLRSGILLETHEGGYKLGMVKGSEVAIQAVIEPLLKLINENRILRDNLGKMTDLLKSMQKPKTKRKP